jgi:hypothetical protein
VAYSDASDGLRFLIKILDKYIGNIDSFIGIIDKIVTYWFWLDQQ